MKKDECEEKVLLLIKDAEEKLNRYGAGYKAHTWRERILLLVELNIPISKLGKYSNPKVASCGARERIKLYFLQNIGKVIDARELEIVGAISEYARRVRELKVEDGYKIISGVSNAAESDVRLKPTQYMLLDSTPDSEAANRWCISNRIRKEKLSSKDKIIKFLKEFVGKVVTRDELYYVSGGRKEYARRIRELRTEDGYQIATIFTGRPELAMGEYVLESLERISEPHDRKIPIEVQEKVYKRDNNACVSCGWNHKRWRKQDPRILELHHIREHAKGGTNDIGNICLLCSKCHDMVHAGKLKLHI